jgi:uncharacterized protein (DUF1501 family)
MTSRRIFLKNGAFALLSFGLAPSFLTRTAAAAAGRPKQLIAIFQRGAVDGLNMIVPYGDKEYFRARPSIAVPRPGGGDDAASDLDGFFGLHPRLSPLKPYWDQRTLAIVHAVGSPDSTRSHFDAQDYLETATPGVKSTQDGWLNRYLQARHAKSSGGIRAVSVTPQLPRALNGAAPALAVADITRFGIPSTQTMARSSFEEQYAAAADQLLSSAGREAFGAMKTLSRVDPARYRPALGVDYPRSAFGQALKQIAQLTKMDLGMEVAFAEVGGWDTHVNQGGPQGQLATRLDDFSRSIASLLADLEDRLDDVVVLTMSEFGRAVSENGNRGTDHGHGNAMVVIGGAVRGGRVYGRWPGLQQDQRYEGRDLAVTTDFRDVFGEIVTQHLGLADPSSIFPDYTIRPASRLGLIA